MQEPIDSGEETSVSCAPKVAPIRRAADQGVQHIGPAKSRDVRTKGEVMATFFIALLIIDTVVLGTVVLLQSGKGGGLAALGGGSSTDSFFGGRQATTILTKMSWWCGGIFFALSLVLAGMSTGAGVPSSILEQDVGAPTPITLPAPTLPLEAPTGEGESRDEGGQN